MDIDSSPSTPTLFGIRGVPTLILFDENGGKSIGYLEIYDGKLLYATGSGILLFTEKPDEKSKQIQFTEIKSNIEEIKKLKTTVDEMFVLCKDCLASHDADQIYIDRVNKKEKATDRIQKDVTLFITCLLEKSLTPEESNEALTIVRIADELESIGDYIQHAMNLNKRYIIVWSTQRTHNTSGKFYT